jgi:hypothetical protein
MESHSARKTSQKLWHSKRRGSRKLKQLPLKLLLPPPTNQKEKKEKQKKLQQRVNE